MKRFLSLLLSMALLCSLCTAFAMGAEKSSADNLDRAERALSVLKDRELPTLTVESRGEPIPEEAKPATRGLLDYSAAYLAPLVPVPTAVRGETLVWQNLLYCNGDENLYFFIAIYPQGSNMEEEPLAYYAEEIPETSTQEQFTLSWDGYEETGYSNFSLLYFTVWDEGSEVYILEESIKEYSAKIVNAPRPATELIFRERYDGNSFFNGRPTNYLRLIVNSSYSYAVNASPADSTTQAELFVSSDSDCITVSNFCGLVSIVTKKVGWATLTLTYDQVVVKIPVEVCWNNGHTMKEPEIISMPTEETNGVTRYACDICGAYYEERTWLTPRVFDTFKDISERDWFCSAVQFAVDRGLFNGVAKDRFAPNDVMTRAMLVTVLYRYSGENVAYESVFEDVPKGIWYSEAVTWAAKNEIVNGMGNGKFVPDGTITREQLATILYRYANKLGADTSKTDSLDFPDFDKLSSWAKDGVQWAVAEGLIQGSSSGGVVMLLPTQGATRAQVATILMRFIKGVKIPEQPELVENSAWAPYSGYGDKLGIVLNDPVEEALQETVRWMEGEYEGAYIIPRYIGSTVSLYPLIWTEDYGDYTIGETPAYSTVAEDGCVIRSVLPRPEGAPSWYIELTTPDGRTAGWVLTYDGRDGTPAVEFFEVES